MPRPTAPGGAATESMVCSPTVSWRREMPAPLGPEGSGTPDPYRGNGNRSAATVAGHRSRPVHRPRSCRGGAVPRPPRREVRHSKSAAVPTVRGCVAAAARVATAPAVPASRAALDPVRGATAYPRLAAEAKRRVRDSREARGVGDEPFVTTPPALRERETDRWRVRAVCGTDRPLSFRYAGCRELSTLPRHSGAESCRRAS